ncbi:MAG: site-specific DNA-methyltransferase, partial [Planctomycetes bacterium]|nr:site-specific DNA-methyltransferase [Planctomycetota bacterium]
DASDLEVPAVPIYIQEKIHPCAIIEDFKRTAAKPDDNDPQLDLFSDFNGLPEDFDQRVDFYQHEGNWSNRLILGDSLLVMTSLAEKERLKGKVQMIYIDPPYGIKFGSNWQVSTRKRDVRDGKAQDVTRQPEQIRAFRDTWKLGVHSYLAYLRDRLVVAIELLTETGSVFVQIGDENVHLVRCVMDEVFGSENFISQIICKKTTGNTGNYLGGAADHILWYGKDVQKTKYRSLFAEKEVGGVGGTGYTRVELPDGTRRGLTAAEIADLATLPRNTRVFTAGNLTSQSIGREKGEGASSWFPVKIGDREYRPSMKVRWKTNESGMARLLAANRVTVSSGHQLAYVRYFDDFPAQTISNVWTDTVGQNQFGGDKSYVVQTALEQSLFLCSERPPSFPPW